jgi:ribose transport system ATP-binding protein
LDEPTSSLPASEVDVLLAALRRYASEGQTILLVTHRFDEVMAIADRATMLRDGRHVGTVERETLSHDLLIDLMVGRAVDRDYHRRAAWAAGNVLLSCRDLGGGKVRGASFDVHAGEILGVAGLLGSGRSTLLRLLFGLIPRGGEVFLDDVPLRAASPSEAMATGLAYIPEDRARESGFADMTVSENISVAVIGSYWRNGHFAHRAQGRDARELMRAYGVRASSERARFASLSGGNQQKVVLARWMRRSPRLLLLDEPTQGVDVGARVELHKLIQAAVDAGAGAILVSSEFEELEALCDRALVLHKGAVVGDVSGAALSAEHLEQLAHSGGIRA